MVDILDDAVNHVVWGGCRSVSMPVEDTVNARRTHCFPIYGQLEELHQGGLME